MYGEEARRSFTSSCLLPYRSESASAGDVVAWFNAYYTFSTELLAHFAFDRVANPIELKLFIESLRGHRHSIFFLRLSANQADVDHVRLQQRRMDPGGSFGWGS